MQPKESKARGKMDQSGHDLLDATVYRSLSVESGSRGFASSDPPRSTSTALHKGSDLLSQPDYLAKGRDFSSSKLSFGAGKSSSVSSVTEAFDAFDFAPKSDLKTQPLPIQDCPPYFESNSSFLTNKLPASVLESVILQLRKKHVDFEYQPLKHKLKGIIYNDDCDRCTFKLKLFKAPVGRTGKYLVEFQRRYGCIVTFRNLYQQILQALVLEGGVVPISGASVGPPPLSLSVSGQVRLDQETLDVLIRSLGNSSEPSTNLENLRETLRVLATLSKTPHNRAVLAEARTTAERTGLCDLLLWVLHLEDSEVRRCGATLLGNVAALETLRGELVSKLLASMFHLLSSTDLTEFSCDLVEKEIQRQAAKTLAIVAETHAAEIAKDVHFSQYMQILAKHKSSADEGLGADVLSTMQRLSAAGNPIESQ